MTVLIDTSFLVALGLPGDNHYEAAIKLQRDSRELRILPEVVLPEFFYVAALRTHYKQAIGVLKTVRISNVERVLLTPDDLDRTEAIMTQYADARFDFVDTAIMALAERLNIRTVFTFDQRDFRLFQPKHCEHLDIKP